MIYDRYLIWHDILQKIRPWLIFYAVEVKVMLNQSKINDYILYLYILYELLALLACNKLIKLKFNQFFYY